MPREGLYARQGKFHKYFPVFPQAALPAVYGGLDAGGSRFGLFPPYRNDWKNPTLDQAADILDHEIGKVDREGTVPKGIELLLNRLHGLQ